MNVQNDNDELFLDLLESDVLRQGLTLAATAQPALGALSSLAVGMAKTIATRATQCAGGRTSNSGSTLAARCRRRAAGRRIVRGGADAAAFQRAWHWADWIYDAGSGQIRNAAAELIPLNYFILGVSPSPTT